MRNQYFSEEKLKLKIGCKIIDVFLVGSDVYEKLLTEKGYYMYMITEKKTIRIINEENFKGALLQLEQQKEIEQDEFFRKEYIKVLDRELDEYMNHPKGCECYKLEDTKEQQEEQEQQEYNDLDEYVNEYRLEETDEQTDQEAKEERKEEYINKIVEKIKYLDEEKLNDVLSFLKILEFREICSEEEEQFEEDEEEDEEYEQIDSEEKNRLVSQLISQKLPSYKDSNSKENCQSCNGKLLNGLSACCSGVDCFACFDCVCPDCHRCKTIHCKCEDEDDYNSDEEE